MIPSYTSPDVDDDYFCRNPSIAICLSHLNVGCEVLFQEEGEREVDALRHLLLKRSDPSAAACDWSGAAKTHPHDAKLQRARHLSLNSPLRPPRRRTNLNREILSTRLHPLSTSPRPTPNSRIRASSIVHISQQVSLSRGITTPTLFTLSRPPRWILHG